MQKTSTIVFSVVLMLCLCCIPGCRQQEKSAEVPGTVQDAETQVEKGEELFNAHCMPCHREGSRLQNVHRPEEVFNAMRNPKGSMPRFEDKVITQEEKKILSRFIFLKILGKQ
jgi:mono/diheme cytochrome c family protein